MDLSSLISPSTASRVKTVVSGTRVVHPQALSQLIRTPCSHSGSSQWDPSDSVTHTDTHMHTHICAHTLTHVHCKRHLFPRNSPGTVNKVQHPFKIWDPRLSGRKWDSGMPSAFHTCWSLLSGELPEDAAHLLPGCLVGDEIHSDQAQPYREPGLAAFPKEPLGFYVFLFGMLHVWD